jgi:hypothetical protein
MVRSQRQLVLDLLSLMPFAAVYAITVRTAEYDLPPEMLDDIVASLMSGAMSIQRGDGRDRGDRQRRDDDDDD